MSRWEGKVKWKEGRKGGEAMGRGEEGRKGDEKGGGVRREEKGTRQVTSLATLAGEFNFL